ncbi:MAG TPA: hypothetical protein VIY70_03325 [Acidimicrobiia bacterium]
MRAEDEQPSRRAGPELVPANETWGRVVGASLAVVTCVFLAFAAGFSVMEEGVPWFGWAALGAAAVVTVGLARLRWRYAVTRWTVVALAASLPAAVGFSLLVRTWRELLS